MLGSSQEDHLKEAARVLGSSHEDHLKEAARVLGLMIGFYSVSDFAKKKNTFHSFSCISGHNVKRH